MSLYRYGDNSVIGQIAVRRSAGRGVRSYLYLNGTPSPENIDGIKNALVENNWHCLPTEVDGKPCLEVRGPRRIKTLEDALLDKKFITSPHTAEIKDDKKIPAKEQFKNNMLLVYGIMNVVADLGMIGYGWLHDKKLKPGEKYWENTAAGIAYSAGSVSFALFGRGDKSDHHMRDIAAKLRDKLQDGGICTFDSACALNAFDAQEKPDAHIRFKRFMHKHSAEFGNGFTALAGAFIGIGARRQTDARTRNVDTALGLSTLIGGGTATLVKEKAPDPDAPAPHGVFGHIRHFVEVRPNRIAGIGYGVSSLAHAFEVYDNVKKAPGEYSGKVVADGLFKGTPKTKVANWAYGMRGGFVALNLIAETVLASASKGNGDGVKSDRSIDESAYALVADTIIRQPPEQREQLFKELSRDFLAKKEVLGGDAAQIEASLRSRVKNLENNPWLGNAKSCAQSPSQPAMENTRWREKFAAEAAPGPGVAMAAL